MEQTETHNKLKISFNRKVAQLSERMNEITKEERQKGIQQMEDNKLFMSQTIENLRSEKDTALLESKNEINKLKLNLEDIEREKVFMEMKYSDLHDENEKNMKKIVRFEKELENLRSAKESKNSKNEAEIIRLSKKLKENEDSYDNLKSELESLKIEYENLN